MEFIQFKRQFQNSFSEFIKDADFLYYTDISKDELWSAYIETFPSDLKQEFNCNSCRSFIKNYGNLVKINSNYQVVSFWDFVVGDPVYQVVIDYLNNVVTSKPITDVFVSETNKLGTDFNFETPNLKWEHLFYELPLNFKTRKENIEGKKSEYRDNKSVFKRSLEELTIEATTTVLELIQENNLYRGSEFKGLLESFYTCQSFYLSAPNNRKDNYCWVQATKPNSLTRVRNTSIGTLLVDLSNGLDLDQAVRKFERVVAPTNYKRPQAIVSAKMLEDAQKTIADLGLTEALHRRFATLDDINVNDVIYVTRNSNSLDIFTKLQKDLVVNPNSFKSAAQLSLEDFVTKVLPGSQSVEVLFENKHQSNLVSLLTAQDPGASNLFKWDNNFSWCYRKGLTDSLKDKVKSAGGKVEGKLRVSLEWYNYDDLDLHIYETEEHIFYGHKKSYSTKGELDVDCNVSPTTRTPVENIIYDYSSNLIYGTYFIKVQNYTYREDRDAGFKVEVEFDNNVYEFSYSDSPKYKQFIDVASFVVNKNGEIKLETKQQSRVNSQTIWNLNTNKFYPVKAIMLSPNYWGNNSVGNKHLILNIEEAKNNEITRGIFNEFLSNDLNKHSKVFELLGNKLNIDYSDNQLSGLGFSSTMRNDFIVKINGNKIYKVTV